MNKTGIAVMLLFALFSGLATAATVNPGTGLYAATLAFKRADTRPKASATLQTGTVGSMAWNDPAANPEIPGNLDFSKAYGSTQEAKWFLLDLNKLKKQGVGAIWVTISVSQVSDATAPANDLVPALTVWQGNLGSTTGEAWFPNTFQSSPSFWGQGLTAFIDVDNKPASATASGTDNTKTSVIGRVKLKKGKQNFLTVAVGGDERLPENKHPVNFKLEVKLSRKKPTPSNNGGGGSGAQFDSYGCKIGSTCWHPQMSHCMAVATCNDAQFAGECLCPK